MTSMTPQVIFSNVARGFLRQRWVGCCIPAPKTISAFLVCAVLTGAACASDHLDSPETVGNPQADIGDVYGWTSTNGERLNLAMTVQGHTFAKGVEYVLHIDSGKVFGHTSASISIACRFNAANAVNCGLGNLDSVSGDPSNVTGLEGRKHRFRVYAGLRDDPFYNNIKGLVGAYQTANAAIKAGAHVDVAGCANFDPETTDAIRNQMTHTDGGPAQNFLGNWTVSAIVVSVDLSAVTRGGKILAVWGSTSSGGKQFDRMARPFVGNTILGISPFSTDEGSGRVRQQYNRATPASATRFVGDLKKGLAFQDSLDGHCGNQLLAEEAPESRYEALSKVFVDDRLWVNSASTVCTQFFAVELARLSRQKSLEADCGGRSPTYDTSNVWRSLLIAGTTTGITDGLTVDEHVPSATAFPFLAAPDAHGINH
jgi:hypothetical protein